MAKLSDPLRPKVKKLKKRKDYYCLLCVPASTLDRLKHIDEFTATYYYSLDPQRSQTPPDIFMYFAVALPSPCTLSLLLLITAFICDYLRRRAAA